MPAVRASVNGTQEPSLALQLMLATMLRSQFFRLRRLAASFAAVFGSALLYAQTPAPPKAEPDVLIFADGEKLIGKLESAKGGSLTFKSDMAGEVTVDWSKVQELRTSHPFAVVTKNMKIVKHADVSQVPEGKLSMTDQKIVLETAGGAPRTIPVADLAFVIGQPDFEKAISHEEGFFEDWGGAVTAGISLVESTQESRTFTGAITLVRAEPTASWLNPSSRTLVDLSGSYGTLSQPGTPEIKTDILHGDAERDQYFSARLFGFARVAFDHNFSQDLDLQQSYGGGLGLDGHQDRRRGIRSEGRYGLYSPDLRDFRLQPEPGGLHIRRDLHPEIRARHRVQRADLRHAGLEQHGGLFGNRHSQPDIARTQAFQPGDHFARYFPERSPAGDSRRTRSSSPPG